jgi:hypothetical protein
MGKENLLEGGKAFYFNVNVLVFCLLLYGRIFSLDYLGSFSALRSGLFLVVLLYLMGALGFYDSAFYVMAFFFSIFSTRFVCSQSPA